MIQAQIHACRCERPNLAAPAPWREVLRLYDTWVAVQDNPVASLNRAVAFAGVHGPDAALLEVDRLDPGQLTDYAPYHAVRADLLRRCGSSVAAREAYDKALALVTSSAEREWLIARRDRLGP